VAALLVQTLLEGYEIPEAIQALLDDLDVGNLSAESNVGEEELELLARSLQRKHKRTLVVGSDLYAHPRAENIAKLLALLERYAGFSVVLIPPATNTLGVALICDLDDSVEGASVGYNAKADFVLSCTGEGDLDMPALNQQEGTFTTLDKRVVPTHAALSYGGYTLNDVAKALGVVSTYTIDYTPMLPASVGYKPMPFDALPNFFDQTGNEQRGYLLAPMKVEVDITIDEVEELDGYDGVVVYCCDSSEGLAAYMRPVEAEMQEKYPTLTGSNQFAMAAKLKDREIMEFKIDGVAFKRVFRIDTSMKGTIALNPVFDMGLHAALLSSYRFSRLTFQRVES